MNTNKQIHLNTDWLNAHGLNIQAVFNLDALQEETVNQLSLLGVALERFSQLILIGHRGKALWQKISNRISTELDPIDNFTISRVRELFSTQYPHNYYQIIYPDRHFIDLQKLGRYAGWHHDSPLKIGIHPEWGTWFAYRAVLLADTNFTPTEIQLSETSPTSPCDECIDKPCIAACPPNACSAAEYYLARCVTYRTHDNSSCSVTCKAREACPVGIDYKYSQRQVNYHYSASLKMIKK